MQIRPQMLWLRKHPFIPSLKDLLSASYRKGAMPGVWVIKDENDPCLKEFMVQEGKKSRNTPKVECGE